MAAMNSNHSPFKFVGTCVDRNSLSHTHTQTDKHTIKCTHTQNLRTWPISLLEALIRVVDRRGKKEKTLACRALLSIKEAKAFFLVASTAFISVWGWGNDPKKRRKKKIKKGWVVPLPSVPLSQIHKHAANIQHKHTFSHTFYSWSTKF